MIGSFQMPVLGQHAHGVGARAEERGMAEGHDAGVAEDEVEREGEEDRDQEFGAEAEMAGEGEIEAEGEDPGDRLPRAQPVASGQGARGRMIGHAGRRRGHVALPRNRPCGRQSRNRMVRA